MRTLNSVSSALTGATRSRSRTNVFGPISGGKKPFPDRLFLEFPSLGHIKQGHFVVDGAVSSSQGHLG